MKFSEIESKQWVELQPFLDTCLLPVTGLTGAEGPVEVTHALEKLRDLMDLVEIPFKGRVVTYPSQHYIADSDNTIEAICGRLKTHFAFVILIAAGNQTELEAPSADLLLVPADDGSVPDRTFVASAVQSMWRQTGSTSDLDK